ASGCRRICTMPRRSASGCCSVRFGSRRIRVPSRMSRSSPIASGCWSSQPMLKRSGDQAAGLRGLMRSREVKVIAVTGGKGGVGKTNVAVNLGTALARLGRDVMLLDADLGLANVDVLLGIRTRRNLEHVLSGECTLQEVVVTAPSGLRVVPASSGNSQMAGLSAPQHAGLIGAFSELFEPLDVLLIDTAAGLSDSVLTFSAAAHRIVVVVC